MSKVNHPFWVIVHKEVSDHVRSWRFLILIGIIALTCMGSLYTALTNIGECCIQRPHTGKCYNTYQYNKTPTFDMIGNFLVDDNPKRMIDFIHVFLLLPQNNGYKYQTIPASYLSILPYQSKQVIGHY